MQDYEVKPFLYCEVTQDKYFLVDGFSIGRSQTADLTIENNNRVSRKHGFFHHTENRFHYTDANSTNGSFINNRRLKENEEVQLCHGVILKIGGRHFTYCERDDQEVYEKTVMTRSGRVSDVSVILDAVPDGGHTALLERQQSDLGKRLDLLADGDSNLISIVRDGVSSAVESPNDSLYKSRAITNRAIGLFKDAEFGDGPIPSEWLSFWKQKNEEFARKPIWFRDDDDIWLGKVPDTKDRFKFIKLLEYMTGVKDVSPVARLVNKEMYYLLYSLSEISGPAGHEELGYFKTSSFALSKMSEGVTLCELISEDLFRK
ncbi:FHA domain-containing protein [Akkermansiaceae bacterium]|nr:FHA domain-containing protein [Akkermansiaceae bacterium]